MMLGGCRTELSWRSNTNLTRVHGQERVGTPHATKFKVQMSLASISSFWGSWMHPSRTPGYAEKVGADGLRGGTVLYEWRTCLAVFR